MATALDVETGQCPEKMVYRTATRAQTVCVIQLIMFRGVNKEDVLQRLVNITFLSCFYVNNLQHMFGVCRIDGLSKHTRHDQI